MIEKVNEMDLDWRKSLHTPIFVPKGLEWH